MKNYGREDGIVLDPEQAEQSLQHTVTYWQSWLEKTETGLTVELGPFQEMVNSSALALKLLFYNPTGAIAAAATTSLPEEIGGVRNWDYRYTWIRDTSFTVQALFNLGHLTKSSSKLFKKKDQRLNFLITPVDPRIHFALVCASSSCPPIDVYTAENLDKELSIAGKTFLNAGGLVLDQKINKLSLSKIFKWYGQDFGKTLAERLGFLAPYLYSKEDREFIEHNSSTIEVSYQDYS